MIKREGFMADIKENGGQSFLFLFLPGSLISFINPACYLALNNNVPF
jgi:hypothetical protein